MTVTYSLGKSWNNKCADPSSIRILQLVQTEVNGKGDTFIDPPPNQKIKTGSGTITTDNLPWYDGTYASVALYKADPLKNQNYGLGPLMVDTPGGWKKTTDWQAWTLVVATSGATATFLGGFTWGFDVTDNSVAATLKTPTAITFDNNLMTSFNNALNAQTWGDPKNPTKYQLAGPMEGCSLTFDAHRTPGPAAVIVFLAPLFRRRRKAA